MSATPVPVSAKRYTEASIPFAYVYRAASGELTRVELSRLNGAEPPPGWESLEHMIVLVPAAADEPPAYHWHAHDWKVFKDMKYAFVEKLIAAGLQYRMCGQVSGTLNALIERNTPKSS